MIAEFYLCTVQKVMQIVNVTISDIAHWAGLSAEVTRDEINKFVERRKIEVYDNYMIVNNINDMKRTFDTRGGARGAGL